MHVNAADQRVSLLWGLSNVTTFFLTYCYGIPQNTVEFLVIFLDILTGKYLNFLQALQLCLPGCIPAEPGGAALVTSLCFFTRLRYTQ